METRFCLDCNTRLLGRADKKFCSDACRNNYNNKLNSDSTSLMRNINNLLRKNRRILQNMIKNDENKATIPVKKLAMSGFSFEYFTHTLDTKTGNSYFFCYEYGYRKLDGDYYLVVKQASRI